MLIERFINTKANISVTIEFDIGIKNVKKAAKGIPTIINGILLPKRVFILSE